MSSKHMDRSSKTNRQNGHQIDTGARETKERKRRREKGGKRHETDEKRTTRKHENERARKQEKQENEKTREMHNKKWQLVRARARLISRSPHIFSSPSIKP